MSDHFFLKYDIANHKLWYKRNSVSQFTHRTCSGEQLTFELTTSGLKWDVPFFLTDNIFYLQVENNIYFGRCLDYFRTYAEPDHDSNVLLREHGFLPHARTQLKDVRIICSYLAYNVGFEGVTVSPLFPIGGTLDKCSVDDLIDTFRATFRKQIERVNRSSWVLPLSGGMDSRMLLSLALEYKDIDLKLFTVGTRRSGDIKVAKSISNRLGLSRQHQILYLEDVTRRDLLHNYKACDYLLPLDRILTKPLRNFFEPSAVLSGLYGDVIFADNVINTIKYSDYYQAERFTIYDSFDRQIVEAYDGLPQLPKLQRTVLRCQKLTRQSFSISPEFDFITPFVDPQVLVLASNIHSPRIYQDFVSRHMHPKLREFIHQSTLSYFTHPNWLRVAERKIFKLFRHPARSAYFDSAYLKSINVLPNETPTLN